MNYGNISEGTMKILIWDRFEGYDEWDAFAADSPVFLPSSQPSTSLAVTISPSFKKI
jgi:hypothetical protein